MSSQRQRRHCWWLCFTCVFVVLAFVVATAPAVAQPVGGGIIEDVTVDLENGTGRVRVAFSCALRYVTHFPQDTGNELRIKLKPAFRCEELNSDLFERSAALPDNMALAWVEDVVFEGDIEGGPFVTVYFTQPVAFEVHQGADFRSLTILVYPKH